jgi:UDP-glucuronate 4-epimerase
MAVLITGALGFIGSHLCERLLAKNIGIVAVDNFDPFYPPTQKRSVLSSLSRNGDFVFIEGNISDGSFVKSLFSDRQYETIFHLAGRGGVLQSVDEPLFYISSIIQGTTTILEQAARHGTKLFINASSSSVYGHSLKTITSEDIDADRPASIYAAAKRSTEIIAHSYFVQYGLSIVNARFFSVYGPRGRPDQVIYKVTRMIMEGTPIPFIYPSPRRDFTFISDIVSALERMVALVPNCFETLNLGFGKSESVETVIKLVENALEKNAVRGRLQPPHISDILVTCSDSSAAARLLGWKPEISLQEGVPMFVEWFKSTNDI